MYIAGAFVIIMLVLYFVKPESFSKCSETNIPVPEYLKDKTISFERDMIYVSNFNDDYGYCTLTEKSIPLRLKTGEDKRDFLSSKEDFKDNAPIISDIGSNTKFKVVKLFFNNSPGDCFVYMVFQDENGVLSTGNEFVFKFYDASKSAGFYEGGQRVGDVMVPDEIFRCKTYR